MSFSDFFEPFTSIERSGASGFHGRTVFAQLAADPPNYPEQLAAVLEALARDLRSSGGDLSQVTLTSRVEGHRYVITATAPFEAT